MKFFFSLLLAFGAFSLNELVLAVGGKQEKEEALRYVYAQKNLSVTKSAFEEINKKSTDLKKRIVNGNNKTSLDELIKKYKTQKPQTNEEILQYLKTSNVTSLVQQIKNNDDENLELVKKNSKDLELVSKMSLYYLSINQPRDAYEVIKRNNQWQIDPNGNSELVFQHALQNGTSAQKLRLSFLPSLDLAMQKKLLQEVGNNSDIEKCANAENNYFLFKKLGQKYLSENDPVRALEYFKKAGALNSASITEEAIILFLTSTNDDEERKAMKLLIIAQQEKGDTDAAPYLHALKTKDKKDKKYEKLENSIKNELEKEERGWIMSLLKKPADLAGAHPNITGTAALGAATGGGIYLIYLVKWYIDNQPK